MRAPYLALSAVVASILGPANAADSAIEAAPYPAAVALIQDPPGIWTYTSFPAFLPLYVFDGEPLGQSTCDQACSGVWPIIAAAGSTEPMGDWTIVLRTDGRKQWAYKNKPVYTYFEDRSGDPHGVGKEQQWYLSEDGVAYLLRAGVKLPSDFGSANSRMPSGEKPTAKLLQP